MGLLSDFPVSASTRVWSVSLDDKTISMHNGLQPILLLCGYKRRNITVYASIAQTSHRGVQGKETHPEY